MLTGVTQALASRRAQILSSCRRTRGQVEINLMRDKKNHTFQRVSVNGTAKMETANLLDDA